MTTLVYSWMNTSADACSAPAGQCASATSNCAMIVGTATAAVLFLSKKLREVLLLPVRIILP